ncbi:hypothetical protein [Richelia intracellularis]|uniref:hypothetical protein n=1 Tax=Richelia intracellularis TaxID=1164990 RepID=UPI0005C685ED|nr:hypothetical protein [Richelia intracellularis]
MSPIQTYMIQTFRRSQNVVGGLDITTNKSAREYLPRTFVGVMDQDNDGLTETIVLYSGNYTRQMDASTTLKHFGVKSSMRFDGGVVQA